MGEIKMRTDKLPEMKLASAKELYNPKVKCPYCGCNQIIHKGAKRDQCRKCKHTFPAHGVKRMRQHFPKIPGFGG